MRTANKPEDHMNNLKPCPFCGGEAKTIADYDSVGANEFLMSAYIQCADCGVYKRVKFNASSKQFSDYIYAFDQVINLWNQRTCEKA